MALGTVGTVSFATGFTATVIAGGTFLGTLAITGVVGVIVVGGATALYTGLQSIMGEALDDKYDLPRNKYIYTGPGNGGFDRMSTLMNGPYTNAMILNELGSTISQLEVNSTLADDALLNLRQSLVSITPVINSMQDRINTAEGIQEFQAILSDLQVLNDLLNGYVTTLIPAIQNVKAQIDSVATIQMQKYYTDRKSTRLNSSHVSESRMPSSA